MLDVLLLAVIAAMSVAASVWVARWFRRYEQRSQSRYTAKLADLERRRAESRLELANIRKAMAEFNLRRAQQLRDDAALARWWADTISEHLPTNDEDPDMRRAKKPPTPEQRQMASVLVDVLMDGASSETAGDGPRASEFADDMAELVAVAIGEYLRVFPAARNPTDKIVVFDATWATQQERATNPNYRGEYDALCFFCRESLNTMPVGKSFSSAQMKRADHHARLCAMRLVAGQIEGVGPNGERPVDLFKQKETKQAAIAKRKATVKAKQTAQQAARAEFDQRVDGLVAKTTDAYARDRYIDWSMCVAALLSRGYTDDQVVILLESKITRWAADEAANPERATADDLLRFIDTYGHEELF